MILDPQLPQPGALVAEKYRIARVLGVGGMGVVYAARHELLNQDVALKLLLPEVAKDKAAVARFLHEGRATARLQSAHVVRVMDVGMVQTSPFLAMELLAGQDLADVLATRKRILVTEMVDWLIEAMEGLSHAHAAGIIHRDLKPSNLFLARGEGDVHTIKVVDFGISKSMGNDGGNITSTSAVLGSPAYMAPEQLRSSKHVDARADVWSLGVIAFELLTNQMPFEGENVGEIFANVLVKPPIRPTTLRVEIPGMLEQAILRCLEKNADDRYSNIGELATAIARYGTGRCDALVESIDKRLAPTRGAPVRSMSIPDLDVVAPAKALASAPTISISKAPPPPISSDKFAFDDEVASGPALLTVDEVASARAARANAPTIITSRAPPRRALMDGWVLPTLLHTALAAATFFALRRYVRVAPFDVFAKLPGTTEGAPAMTSAIVGGAYAVACIACGAGAIASRSARAGWIVSSLGFFASAIGMFLIMGSASGGVVGMVSGEKMFVTVGSVIVAVGFALACLGKARDAWRDDARALPPLLALLAGAFAFCALKLATFL